MKRRIKTGLISGIVFAAVMAIFDYVDNELFSIWQFIFYGAFYGIFIAWIAKFEETKKES